MGTAVAGINHSVLVKQVQDVNGQPDVAGTLQAKGLVEPEVNNFLVRQVPGLGRVNGNDVVVASVDHQPAG